MIRVSEHQLFMLGANAPPFARLFASRHRLGKLPDVFDYRIFAIASLPRAHGRGS
jgi:hypothetical protein